MRSTLREQPAPLPEADRHLLADRFVRWVDRLRPTGFLDPDLAVWDRLLDRDDAAWLGHRTDMFRLVVRTTYVGTKAG
jgi:hypothetical protein